MKKPFISIIIPTYNRADTIERAVSSVIKQDFSDYELIIVDDGSTDKTQEHLMFLTNNKFKNIFIKLLKTENKGVSAARNYGVENARADWLAFLDSDDEWLSEKLSLQVQHIKNNPHKLIHGEENWIRNGVKVNKKKKHEKTGGDVFNAATELCFISPSTAVIERDLFEKYGGFREDYPVCEDYDLWLKITSDEEIGYITKPLINKYGGHEDQLSHKYKAMDYYRVKSIKWILENKDLRPDQIEQSLKTGISKSEILMKGYQKHDNPEKEKETQVFLDFFSTYNS
jgi:glycosyltransferase involved in cell wall biosynthesis